MRAAGQLGCSALFWLSISHMKIIYLVTFSLLLIIMLPVKASGQETYLFQSEQNLQPSLVRIKAFTIKVSPVENGQARMLGDENQGNGVIIDPSGIIVTNRHIVANMEHILVTLSDGKTSEATVLYSDEIDFCFLKINPPYPLKAIARADFSQTKDGDPVIVLLHNQSILKGTISSLIHESGSKDVDLLELKLDLHPGDSGGSVFSEQGCFLGLIMARRDSDAGISYAISSHRIWNEYQKYNGSVLVGS